MKCEGELKSFLSGGSKNCRGIRIRILSRHTHTHTCVCAHLPHVDVAAKKASEGLYAVARLGGSERCAGRRNGVEGDEGVARAIVPTVSRES